MAAVALQSDHFEAVAPCTAGLALDDPPSGCSNASSQRESITSTHRKTAGDVREARGEVREGEVVEGRYRIGRLLGSGAMGTVFAAHHILLDQKVAIKFLVPESLGHSDSVARFVREARATATIKSEHVVRVLDVALWEGGGPYIVMEYLEGCDLAAWLRTHGVPEVHVAVDFVLQACDAIAEAHELGIIHRDLKPANLFAVQRDGVVETIKVLDFGISKTPGLVSSTAPPGEWRPGAVVTEERTPIGSPCYMSPEQMESARDVDRRTDIWALGVTLCELVTGHLPFEGQSLVQIYALIKSGLRLRWPEDAPRGLEAVIRKCLEPERDRRYASVRELQAALAPFGLPPLSTTAEETRRSERGYEADTPESRHVATPSPRVLDVPRSQTTLVSGEAAPSKRGGSRNKVIAAVGFAASLIAIGGLSLVSKTLNPTQSLASHGASATPAASALLQEDLLGSSPEVQGRAALGAPSPRSRETHDREPNREPSSPKPSGSPPALSAPGDVAKGGVARVPAVSSPRREPRPSALTGNALALASHDPLPLAGDSAPPVPAPSSSAPPSASPSEEWLPPPVPK
jgi:serine/threonine protein kinase